MNVREWMEVVEWNKRCSPPFFCCTVCCHCLWKKTLRGKKTDTWPHKLLIISSLSLLGTFLKENLLFQKDLWVSFHLWFGSLSGYLHLKIFCLLWTLNFLSNLKEYFYSLRVQISKNIVFALTAAWCCFFGYFRICIFLRIITEISFFRTRKVFSNIHHQIIFLLYFVK